MDFYILKQTITADKCELVSDTKNIYKCKFTFDKEWDGFARTAVFKRGEVVIEVILDENDMCDLPYEMLTNPGQFIAGVFGSKEDKRYPTIYTDSIRVKKGVENGDLPMPPTPSVYDQIATKYDEILDKYTDMGEIHDDVVANAKQVAEDKETVEQLKTETEQIKTTADEILETINRQADNVSNIEQRAEAVKEDITKIAQDVSDISDFVDEARDEVAILAAETKKAQTDAKYSEVAARAYRDESKTLRDETSAIKRQVEDDVTGFGIRIAKVENDVKDINDVIPTQASESNLLADRDYVNAQISSYAADFKGNFTNLEELLNTPADINDFANYNHSIDGNEVVDRYRYSSTGWLFDFRISSPLFTSDQWKAINSGATKEVIDSIFDKVEKEAGKSLLEDTEIARLKSLHNYDDTEIRAAIDNTYTKQEVDEKIAEATPSDYEQVKQNVATNTQNITSLQTGKQDEITDLETIRAGADKGATAVQDENYVHTDNNYTDEEKQKLEGIEEGANNYVLPDDVVQDENYVHTDNNYTDEEKNKLQNASDKVDGLISDEEVTLENTWSSQKIAGKINDIELAKFPNVTIVGQPTIQQGQISNFSRENYCRFPFVVDFQNQAFKLDFEITTGADVTQQHNVFDSAFGLAFAVRQSKFVLAVSTNGTSWNIGEVLGSHVVLPNTTYRIRLVWDKQNLTLEYSTDGGETYVVDSTRALTEQPYPKQMFIGVTSNVLEPQSSITIFNGIINLNYAKLSIANKVVWQGMDDVGLATRMAVDMSNIDEAGVNKVKSIIDSHDNIIHYEEGVDPETETTYTAAEIDTFLRKKANADDVYTKEEIDQRLETAKVVVSLVGSRGGIPSGNTINVYIDGQLQMSSAYNGSPITFECDKGVTYEFEATDIKPFYDAEPIVITVVNNVNLTINMVEIGDTTTYEGIHQIIKHGVADEFFNIGDQIFVDWQDTATGVTYNVPLDVVAFRDVELEDGSIVPSMLTQWHYCSPFGVQFDAFEAFYCAEDAALPIGSYSFKMDGAIGSNLISGNTYYFTTTQVVPKGGLLCFNTNGDGNPTNVVGWANGSATSNLFSVAFSTAAISGAVDLGTISTNNPTNGLNYRQRVGWGYNSWSKSAIRQYLNSKLDKYSWWESKNKFDRYPAELATKNGHMSGYKQEFLDILGKIKITTFKNTVSDNGTADYTYDTFFLPSLEEVYCVPQVKGEGEYYPYWKIKSGTDAPNAQGSTNANLRTFGIDNINNAQNVRLRSANRTLANNTWYVNSSGYVYSYSASSSFRFAPTCAII